MPPLSIRQFRLQFCQHLEAVRNQGKSYTITYHDRPIGVLVPLVRYLQLLEGEASGNASPNAIQPILAPEPNNQGFRYQSQGDDMPYGHQPPATGPSGRRSLRASKRGRFLR